MASLRSMGKTFVWPFAPMIFRMQSISRRQAGRLTKIFTGAILRPPIFYEQSQIAGLEGVGPTTTQNRSAGTDIVSRPLERAGAERADPAHWPMMNEKGDMYSPRPVCDFAVYSLPTRPVREPCNSNGPWGCRLGPSARGSLTQRLVAPTFVPPATRKVFQREIIQILEIPRKSGTRRPWTRAPA